MQQNSDKLNIFPFLFFEHLKIELLRKYIYTCIKLEQ